MTNRHLFPFQKLDAYVAAQELAEVCGRCRGGELKDQLGRASLSVVLNLAEGLPSRMPGYRRKYFTESMGSLHEVVAALDFAERTAALAPVELERARALSFRLRGMIWGLQRSSG